TYKHEPFIEEAVLSILNQKTSFDYELIIGDDKSPDNTEEIVRKIINDHPEGKRIKYFRNEKNIGITPNSKKALDKVKGEYFATCEGDDFWIDENKLQRQVDFMDNNPDFAICFHDTRIDFFDQKAPSYLLNESLE